VVDELDSYHVSAPENRTTGEAMLATPAVPTIGATVRMPVAMRSRLERVRLRRAETTSRVPRLRELILEAISRFLDEEIAEA